METEEEICVALLHDVVEDTPWPLGYLREAGFPKSVTDAVALLTHHPGVPYFDYVEKIRKNPIARRVKLADLEHNSDLGRLDNPTEKTRERREKYLKAIEILKREL
jgi:(p)ppGpp synthase/HD superfamily hydrolase